MQNTICKTDEQKILYLFTLLVPFERENAKKTKKKKLDETMNLQSKIIAWIIINRCEQKVSFFFKKKIQIV